MFSRFYPSTGRSTSIYDIHNKQEIVSEVNVSLTSLFCSYALCDIARSRSDIRLVNYKQFKRLNDPRGN